MLRNLSSYCRPELLTTVRCYVRKAGNPGLNKLLKNVEENYDIVEDPEGFGDIETDFMDAHKSHRKYEQEVKIHRQLIHRKMIGNKYFKHNEPNFLTYAEKEQIKLLHSRDSNEWNPEKLSESFPATAEIIVKILKGKWVAATAKRIEKHDQSVIKNWSLFNKGEFDDLDPILKEHLVKFTKRKPEDLKNLSTVVRPKRELPKPTITEFSGIISDSMKFRKIVQPQIEESNSVQPQIPPSFAEKPTPFSSTLKPFSKTVQPQIEESDSVQPQIPPSFAEKPTPFSSTSNPFNNISSSNKNPHVQPSLQPPALHPSNMEDETYLTSKIYNKKPMRFQDLVRRNPEVEQDHKELLLQQVENPTGTGVVKVKSEDHNPLGVSKFQANEVEINVRDMINLSSTIRQKIHIPRRLWKKGFSYKLNDCYYDDDGEFLYRVPGMTGNNVQ